MPSKSNGATFGNYGIEIDEPNTVSPDDTDVLADIPHEFGNKAADMTIYRAKLVALARRYGLRVGPPPELRPTGC